MQNLKNKKSEMAILNAVLMLTALCYTYPGFAVMQIIILKNIYFKSFHIKIVLIIAAIAYFIVKIKRESIRFDNISKLIMAFLAFSLISLFLTFRHDYPLKYILYSYNVQLFWIYAAFFLYMVTRLDEDSFNRISNQVERFILAFLVINFLFGLLQHFFNSAVIPTASADGYYKTYFSQLGPRFKAIGLLSTCLNFGMLNCIGLFIALAGLARSKGENIFSVIAATLSIAGVLMSYTRVPYLMAFFGITFLIAVLKRNEGVIKALPALYFLVGFLIALSPLFVKLAGFPRFLEELVSLILSYKHGISYAILISVVILLFARRNPTARKRIILAIVGFVTITLATYFLRNAFLFVLLGTLLVYFTMFKNFKLMIAFPLIGIIVALILVFDLSLANQLKHLFVQGGYPVVAQAERSDSDPLNVAPQRSGVGSIEIKTEGDVLSSTGTLQNRYENWIAALGKLRQEGAIGILFGTGLLQNERFPEITKGMQVDSLYISFAVYSGVVSVIVLVGLYITLYRKMAERVISLSTTNHVALASICLFAVLPGVAFFNDFIPDIYIFLLVPVLLLSVENRNYSDRSQKA